MTNASGVVLDHECWWTSRRESQLARGEGRVWGAGASLASLRHAAALLGTPLTVTALPPDDDGGPDDENQSVQLGAWGGGLHDQCFVGFDADDPALRKLLVDANLALHSSYLGAPLPDGHAAALMDLWTEDSTIRIRSEPGKGIWVKHYPNGASWWTRLTSARTLFQAR